MTDEQKELLKAMHLIKEHCENCKTCEECILCWHLNNGLWQCAFNDEPGVDWGLHSLNTKEKINSVFRKFP